MVYIRGYVHICKYTHTFRHTHTLGVSTVLVNYIGTTVSPALFIVRYRRKLLSVRLVTSRFVTSTTTVGRCGDRLRRLLYRLG